MLAIIWREIRIYRNVIWNNPATASRPRSLSKLNRAKTSFVVIAQTSLVIITDINVR